MNKKELAFWTEWSTRKLVKFCSLLFKKAYSFMSIRSHMYMQHITTHKNRNEDVAMENNRELFWFLSRWNCIMFLMRFYPSQADELFFIWYLFAYLLLLIWLFMLIIVMYKSIWYSRESFNVSCGQHIYLWVSFDLVHFRNFQLSKWGPCMEEEDLIKLHWFSPVQFTPFRPNSWQVGLRKEGSDNENEVDGCRPCPYIFVSGL